MRLQMMLCQLLLLLLLCAAVHCAAGRAGGVIRDAFIVSVRRLTSDTTNTTASRQFSALRAR